MKTCFPFWINYRVLQTTMINWISLKKEEEKKEEEGEKRFSQLWCDKNSILNWNTQYPRDSFKKFSNKQLTANGSRDESKSARVKTDRRSVARNQLKSGRETSIESLTGGEKKNGKKRIAMWQTLVGVANTGKNGRHRFGNPATVCFPCPVESNRNTEKSRRSVAPDLIKKSVVVKCIGLPRSDSDRVDSSFNNRFKYRGTVDSSSIRMHSRASGERRGPKKKKKKQN